MKNVNHSQVFLRKRKMMMVFPLLVLPFLTMAFWAMGGGKEVTAGKKQAPDGGLNLQLPNANLKDDKGADKMSFYEQAEKDSMKLAEMLRNDPYHRNQDSMEKVYTNELEQLTQASADKFNPSSTLKSGLNTSPYNHEKNPAEERVMQKLAQLNQAINQPQNYKTHDNNSEGNSNPASSGEFNPSVERLENMMQIMNKRDGDDPEIKQLNTTLEKILDIQHPERVNDRVKQASIKNRAQVYNVISTRSIGPDNNYLQTKADTNRRKLENAFYDLMVNERVEEQDNSVAAVIHQTQIVVAGSTVKLRLLNDIYVGGMLIPENSFVYGSASLEEDRLLIKIETIRYKNNLLPVKLSVYDMDGLAGIHIPGSISRDVAKQSTDQTIQSLELASLDPSLKVQAANAGVNMAKNLFTKKTKLVKVTVKAGYQVLLRDNNKQEN